MATDRGTDPSKPCKSKNALSICYRCRLKPYMSETPKLIGNSFRNVKRTLPHYLNNQCTAILDHGVSGLLLVIRNTWS